MHTRLTLRTDNTINAKPGTSSISVTCTQTANPATKFSYSITLSSGPGSFAARKLTGTGATLTYNLYVELAHSTVWGDGTSGTVAVGNTFNVGGGGGGTGSDVQTMYGLIGAAQNVLPGGEMRSGASP